MDIHKLYSISDAFNTPSVKFKRKLGAKWLKLGLSVDLFGKWHRNFKLKDYDLCG